MPRIVLVFALMVTLLISSQALAKGKPIDFTLPTAFESQVKLSDFRGRVVVLDFMASWCRPCLQAIPHLNQIDKEYKDRGLSVIGFDVDEPASKVRTMVARYKINFPVVLGSLKKARSFAPITGLPTTVILDPEGRVVARYVGGKRKGTFVNAAKRYFSDDAPRRTGHRPQLHPHHTPIPGTLRAHLGDGQRAPERPRGPVFLYRSEPG